MDNFKVIFFTIIYIHIFVYILILFVTSNHFYSILNVLEDQNEKI